MPTDPFVPPDLDDRPRQQQNLPPGLALPPARDWRADRPGDLGAGAARGRAARPPGSERRLRVHARGSGPRTACGSRRTSTPTTSIAVIAEIAGKRAASFGRAPVIGDVDVAIALLGYDGSADDAFVDAAGAARARGRARLPAPARRSSTRSPTTLLRQRAPSSPTSSTSGGRSRRRRLERRRTLGVSALTAFVLPDEYDELRDVGAAARRGARSRRTRPRPTSARNTRGRAGRRGATPGFAGLAFPEEYGGQGGGILAHAIAVEEVARGLRVVVAVHVHLEARR